MKNILFTILMILLAVSAHSQQASTHPKMTVGIELDALPYITGGYYGSVWAGREHLRYRAIVTRINTPSFMVENGFTNNTIQSYTAIADYFFAPGFKKWWVGSGLEYWQGKVQTDRKLSTGKYDNMIFTAGAGYVWKFYRNFYLNPWIAAHARIAGDSQVYVDGVRFRPATFTPEASLKIGWHL